jgi:hypothetical protein
VSDAKPILIMLLSRHPYAEKSGRGFMLRQRIAQLRARFDLRLVAMDRPAGDASDEGVTFLGMAPKRAVALNAFRLRQLPLQTWFYYSAEARARIEALARESGAAGLYIDMLRLAPLAQKLPANIVRIIDYDDLLSVRYRLARGRGYDVLGFLSNRFGALAGVARMMAAPILALEAQRCATYERELMRQADVAIFTSAREAQTMTGQDGAVVLAAPPTLAPYAAPSGTPGGRLIFLGNLHYAENVTMLRSLAEAAEALRGEGAWPAGVVIDAIGDHAPSLAARFAGAPIRFLGRLDDLSALRGEGVFLAPVTSGSGVKLKVLDGLALSCPVVATPKALEGLSARANRDLILARDPKAVLSTALKLRTRPALKAALARRGRAYLQRAHAPALGSSVCDAIEAAILRAKAR